MNTADRLELVRKLAHDVNGPLGNITAFLELGLQQINYALDQDNSNTESVKMGAEMLSMAMPSIIQLQRNIRMWSATHQIVSQEYGVQLSPVELSKQIENSFHDLAIFLEKKEIKHQVRGDINNSILVDAELFGLIIFHLFDMAVAVGDQNQTLLFEINGHSKNGLSFQMKLDGNYPNLKKMLLSDFDNVEDLPASFDFGVIKSLAYGNIFIPQAIRSMGGEIEVTIEQDILEINLSFKED